MWGSSSPKAKAEENIGKCSLVAKKMGITMSRESRDLFMCWNNNRMWTWMCMKTLLIFFFSSLVILSPLWQGRTINLGNRNSSLAEEEKYTLNFSEWTKSLMWLIQIGKGGEPLPGEWVRVLWIELQPRALGLPCRLPVGARCRRRWWCTEWGRSARYKSGMGSRKMDMAGHPPKVKETGKGTGPGPWGEPSERTWPLVPEQTHGAQAHVGSGHSRKVWPQQSLSRGALAVQITSFWRWTSVGTESLQGPLPTPLAYHGVYTHSLPSWVFL